MREQLLDGDGKLRGGLGWCQQRIGVAKRLALQRQFGGAAGNQRERSEIFTGHHWLSPFGCSTIFVTGWQTYLLP